MIALPFAFLAMTPCLAAAEACQEQVIVTGQRFVSVYRNFPLVQPNSVVDRAVIMIHGTARNADGYFHTALAAAVTAERLNETLLVAPHFKGSDRGSCRDALDRGELGWPCEGWKEGAPATNLRGAERAYSFDVIDRLVTLLNNRANFPNLKTIIIAGHSAGGQFLHRYLATSKVDQSSSVPIRYVVANPSSYLYLNALRLPHRATCTAAGSCSDKFGPYQDAESCTGFNRYRYGLENRTNYAAQSDEASTIRQMVSRNVTYLLGDLDSFDDGSMDSSCPARAQGPNRRDRGIIFWNYVRSQFHAEHTLSVVPNCGHSASCIFTSDAGVKAVFQ